MSSHEYDRTATYSRLRERLAEIWDDVEDTREPVILKRKGHEDLAILPADELESLKETAYLLRSPKNAKRLLEAFERALRAEGEVVDPRALRTENGLTDKVR